MLGLAAAVLAWLYGWIRTVLAAPVMAVEGIRNPIAALSRSWHLTAGNVLRIFAFLALIGVAFTVVLMIATALAGVLLSLLLPAAYAALGVLVLSAALGALMLLTLVAALAATHAQLTAHDSQPDGGRAL